MQGDHSHGTSEGKPERAPLKTHEFRFDPFERLRIARKNVSFDRPVVFPKRLVLAVGAAVIATGTLAGASVFIADAGDAQSSSTELERSLSGREAQLKQREDKVAELERRRGASENEIKDSEKRVADLERRRADLQRQIAELTAPIAPSGDEQEQEQPSSPAVPEQRAALDADDPSPPDETVDASISASSRASGDDSRPSTVEVERTAAPQPEAQADEALEPSGPVRVFIHVRSADPAARERAEAVAAELRRRGVAVAQIRGVLRPVQRDAVRFYYDADRKAVSALQDAVRLASPLSDADPQSQDFRGYRAPPKPGTLELWLS